MAAQCQGHDLFPALKSEAPHAFGHGKLFRLSRAGTAPSYVFATLHLSDPRITNLSPQLAESS
jgi:uncharacterized protein